MAILHTVSLTLFHQDTFTDEGASSPSYDAVSSPTFLLHKPIAAELSVKYTRRWGSRPMNTGNNEEKVQFWYEVDAGGNGEDWIVGGQRRWCFTARVRLRSSHPSHFELNRIRKYLGE